LRRALLVAVAALLTLGAGAAPLRVETLAGEPVELALAPGDAALVVHFWATWCPDCKTELEGFARAAAACEAGRVRVVCVNVGEPREVVERFAAEHAPGLAVMRDPKGRVWREVSGAGLPVHVVWTPAGRRVELGAKTAEDWRRTLVELGCTPGP
jgi:thiol-disulfide isomerase/thioredoxin